MIKPSFFEGDPRLKNDSPILKCIDQILQKSNLVQHYLDNVDLNQIYSLKYGTVPIVRNTVAATIEELGEGNSTLNNYLADQFK